ncbi:acyl carrier protein [Streptomyces sp. NBC_01216]|uniref:acyl carrier protein n=1 Tax=unclassified Streptomyces TaxID=2593676 RepID=UPI002E15D3F9|nr:acyl carrier protein [Streptomyces sp. NBC_01216]
MSTIRTMLVELTGTPEFAEGVGDDEDLSASGIDSGDLVRLVLLIEQRTGAEVTAEDMEGLATIADFERYLADRETTAQSGAN